MSPIQLDIIDAQVAALLPAEHPQSAFEGTNTGAGWPERQHTEAKDLRRLACGGEP
jgi:hypothetical protein